mmetsp:Transcript_1000/g.625  ORF Transcript_1000/g.625 Transcript_1000/m.625 type:complete len:106 (-) Transcript_1000:144-461(-)
MLYSSLELRWLSSVEAFMNLPNFIGRVLSTVVAVSWVPPRHPGITRRFSLFGVAHSSFRFLRLSQNGYGRPLRNGMTVFFFFFSFFCNFRSDNLLGLDILLDAVQ